MWCDGHVLGSLGRCAHYAQTQLICGSAVRSASPQQSPPAFYFRIPRKKPYFLFLAKRDAFRFVNMVCKPLDYIFRWLRLSGGMILHASRTMADDTDCRGQGRCGCAGEGRNSVPRACGQVAMCKIITSTCLCAWQETVLRLKKCRLGRTRAVSLAEGIQCLEATRSIAGGQHCPTILG